MFGIPNCDTVKKARTWLDSRGIAYAFHDYKKAGADAGKLTEWAGQIGWDRLVNRAGTTFRKLAPEDQAALAGAEAGAMVLAANASCIKRPLVERDGKAVLVGFKEAEWEAALG